MTDLINELHLMINVAVGAGELIMKYYRDGFNVWDKEDKTPVTCADIASSEYIIKHLSEAYPDHGMLCEESADRTDSSGNLLRLASRRVFIIDPIDGTRSFINHTDHFAVSIGLADNHELVSGVIFAPALNRLYYATRGYGAYRVDSVDPLSPPHPFDGTRLKVSDRTNGLIALVSDPGSDTMAEKLLEANSHRISKIVRLGSCLKGCAIAEGSADIHYKFATYTKEWDTAAEEIICCEAGAVFTDAYGDGMFANREDYVNRRGIRILNRAESALSLPKDNL